MKLNKTACLALAFNSLAWSSAHALAPDKFYAKTAPSVWHVFVYDADGLSFAQGSAVVVARETLLTNCHVLAKAKRVAVRQGNVSYDAKLEHIDVERDLCQIKARDMTAPAVPLGDSDKVAVGQRMYTLGNPKNLELTLSDGLVSALRKDDNNRLRYIQTSAPFSHGSSGGGLFDEDGRLVGITTLITRDAQNLNFAIPINYLKDLPARSAAALAKRAAALAAAAERQAAPSAAPVTGDTGRRPGPQPAPVASGYADIGNIDKLVELSPRAKAGYEAFLLKPFPRAFALTESGGWWSSWSLTPKDPTVSIYPSVRAVPDCEKNHRQRCFLYAVDDVVVYKPEPRQQP
jgi:S1-C subfamily serine protease